MIGFVRFLRLDAKRWQETYYDRKKYIWEQVAENDDFIELQDSTRGIRVRLHATVVYKMNDANDHWVHSQTGYWLK